MVNDDYRRIGRLIRLAREEMCLSQFDFGDLLGFTQSKVSNLENGRLNVTVDDLRYIAAKLNKPFLYFFEGDDLKEYLAYKGPVSDQLVYDKFKKDNYWSTPESE